MEKKTKTIEDQVKEQTKSIEEHGKQVAESNTLIEKYDYDTEKFSPVFLKQKKYQN